MSITIRVVASQRSVLLTDDLTDWINLNGDSDLKAQPLEEAERHSESMGAIATGLSVILGSRGLLALLKLIGGWAKDRTPQAQIHIQVKNNGKVSSVTIDTSNEQDVKSLLEMAGDVAKKLGA